jgi:hypothetical protein
MNCLMTWKQDSKLNEKRSKCAFFNIPICLANDRG